MCACVDTPGYFTVDSRITFCKKTQHRLRHGLTTSDSGQAGADPGFFYFWGHKGCVRLRAMEALA